MLALLTPTRLDRYVFRQLLIGLAVSTLGLVALVWLTQSLRFIQMIIQHGLSPFVFLHLTGLLVPSFVAVILPITCFIVILFVYARLAADRELTVMRASGMSDAAIARPALALATLTTLACWTLNLWLVPSTLAKFTSFESVIRNQVAAFLLEPGVFTAIPGHVTVYVQRRDPDQVLHGIIIQDARQKGEPATILARSGRLIESADGPAVLLRDGSREQLDPKTGQLNILSFDRNLISLAKPRGGTVHLAPKTSEATMAQLLHPDAMQIAPEVRRRWREEAWRRIASPFAVLSYAVLALLAVLRSPFRRQGGTAALVAAVFGVMGLVAVELGVETLAARQNALIPLIFVVTLGPALAGLGLLLRGVRRLREATA
ncbi:MAG TPA: LPS export ABC transporter permease LptF [Acidiphilium sp.]|uniref:LPS export ABC transporter permease LptF n=1 Tax=unclassified Acidiphilium TaxID=2617493 RepID=UPI000BD08737|nr:MULTISPECIES: LPS export ABC transporter permease LptF [unclassified Acidiphilium]OYV55763.1 MAG: LPS export ABC transporter permease LptF [Acidiphilium sp. 20-67-58]HQT60255.1 LPS export ABC transporter permease LptF [Acidiphilium sp.]HQU12078.1 LPS export ABC transporter permease LptF [Acidiphilium sp.]